MMIRKNNTKWILRRILYKYVPEKLIERPKMGFAIPIDAWLRGPIRHWAESLLDRDKLVSQGYLNVELIHKKWNKHQSGESNWQYQLWNILMFQAWHERWINT
jgi:asparagine synthase (glutamine-hydrolysing)